MAKKYTMHVVSGTHWDREWRHTAEQSKLRLVDLMDNIINVLENNKDYKCFCVDGGMIVIEDYLTIRPENKERIKKLIKDKKMWVVNWYTLPETNTVAPESLIRNLLWGHKMAEEYGGGMKSGYTATSYGQPSQLPQIYRGFDIDTAIFYRGTNHYVIKTPLFKWEGADGSTLDTLRTFDEVTRTNWFFYVHNPIVLGKPSKDLSYTYDKSQIPVHMADMNLYEKAFVLLHEDFDFNHDPEVLKKGINAIYNQAEPYKIGNHLLALNMEDNDEPYKYLPQMIDEMNEVSEDVEFVQESLDDYMDIIRAAMPEDQMYHHKGELRYTTMEYNNFNSLLGATHASRVKLKMLNDKCENYLMNSAEPLASFASFYGKEYPRTNLNRAWEYLLKCHAHDSICGAAVDRAHEDMLYNFSLAQTVAEEVTARSVIALYNQVDSSKNFEEDDHIITLFNTLPYARKEVVPLVIDTPKGGVKVKVDTGVDGMGDTDEFYDIVDKDGNLVDYTELGCEDIKIAVEREMDTKAIKFPARRRRILIEAEVPAMGYATYALRFRGPKFEYFPQIGDNRKLIARDNGVLENENLKVKINPNGTFSMTYKKTGRTMENLHYFTDSGETGSAHVSTQPIRNPIMTSHGAVANITLMETNLHRGTFKVELTMKIPAAATIDGKDRFTEMKELPITYFITLEKGSEMLKIKTILDNECRDHKLCVNFPSGINTDWAISESAFDVAKRTIKWTEDGDNQEKFFPFQPMQNFVDLSDGKEGLALFTKGLREYEIQDDADRTMKLTLLRTQRAYMTANNDMTPDELAQYTGQHSIGKLTYEYALYPHMGDWEQGHVFQKAYDFKVSINAVKGVVKSGVLPVSASLIKINHDDKVLFSAIKQAEDGNGTTIRMWNITGEDLDLEVSTILPVKSVIETKMDESYIRDVDFKDGKFTAKMGPHKILTFILK